MIYKNKQSKTHWVRVTKDYQHQFGTLKAGAAFRTNKHAIAKSLETGFLRVSAYQIPLANLEFFKMTKTTTYNEEPFNPLTTLGA